MNQIFKYPRTKHIEGSKLQIGDEDLSQVKLSDLQGKHLVSEEKMDGANSAISFSDEAKLQLQSRGHYLTGGPREKHFDLFKTWANMHSWELYKALANRYVMYGEWLYAKHTVFYTDLPHYFMEFDILDTQTGEFLDTESRKEILEPLGFVKSVKVLHEGSLNSIEELRSLVGPSYFIGKDHIDRLRAKSRDMGLSGDQVVKETDKSNIMEGLYIKWEEDGVVKGRYKFVRGEFLQAVFEAEGHWLDRPIIPNELEGGKTIFEL